MIAKPNLAHSLKTYFLGLLTKVNFSNWNLLELTRLSEEFKPRKYSIGE